MPAIGLDFGVHLVHDGGGDGLDAGKLGATVAAAPRQAVHDAYATIRSSRSQRTAVDASPRRIKSRNQLYRDPSPSGSDSSSISKRRRTSRGSVFSGGAASSRPYSWTSNTDTTVHCTCGVDDVVDSHTGKRASVYAEHRCETTHGGRRMKSGTASQQSSPRNRTSSLELTSDDSVGPSSYSVEGFSSTALSTPDNALNGGSSIDQSDAHSVCSESSSTSSAMERRIDALLSATLLALESSNALVISTLAGRAELARLRAAEHELEVGLAGKEHEMRERLEGVQGMTGWIERATVKLGEAVDDELTRARLNASTIAAATAAVEASRKAYASGGGASSHWRVPSFSGLSAVFGASEPESPREDDATIGKTAAKRLEKVLRSSSAGTAAGLGLDSHERRHSRTASREVKNSLGAIVEGGTMRAAFAPSSDAEGPPRSASSSPFPSDSSQGGLDSPVEGMDNSAATTTPRWRPGHRAGTSGIRLGPSALSTPSTSLTEASPLELASNDGRVSPLSGGPSRDSTASPTGGLSSRPPHRRVAHRLNESKASLASIEESGRAGWDTADAPPWHTTSSRRTSAVSSRRHESISSLASMRSRPISPLAWHDGSSASASAYGDESDAGESISAAEGASHARPSLAVPIAGPFGSSGLATGSALHLPFGGRARTPEASPAVGPFSVSVDRSPAMLWSPSGYFDGALSDNDTDASSFVSAGADATTSRTRAESASGRLAKLHVSRGTSPQASPDIEGAARRAAVAPAAVQRRPLGGSLHRSNPSLPVLSINPPPSSMVAEAVGPSSPSLSPSHKRAPSTPEAPRNARTHLLNSTAFSARSPRLLDGPASGAGIGASPSADDAAFPAGGAGAARSKGRAGALAALKRLNEQQGSSAGSALGTEAPKSAGGAAEAGWGGGLAAWIGLGATPTPKDTHVPRGRARAMSDASVHSTRTEDSFASRSRTGRAEVV